MISGSMSSPNCMFRTGEKNSDSRLLKELLMIVLLTDGQMLMMSKPLMQSDLEDMCDILTIMQILFLFPLV